MATPVTKYTGLDGKTNYEPMIYKAVTTGAVRRWSTDQNSKRAARFYSFQKMLNNLLPGKHQTEKERRAAFWKSYREKIPNDFYNDRRHLRVEVRTLQNTLDTLKAVYDLKISPDSGDVRNRITILELLIADARKVK